MIIINASTCSEDVIRETQCCAACSAELAAIDAGTLTLYMVCVCALSRRTMLSWETTA
jgi:hypothetical protein